MYHHGWFQIAFDRDLNCEVSQAIVGTRRLVVVRAGEQIRVFDSTCPHRGADLAVGGRFDGSALVCPFHGYRIGLGKESEHGFGVRGYRTLAVGGLVFVQLSQHYDNGFEVALLELNRNHFIMPGFSLNVRSPAEMIIENAFDQAHFRPVHTINTQGVFQIHPTWKGEFAVQGMFDLPASLWQRRQSGCDAGPVPFSAKAFSPGIVISDLGGPYPYGVITASKPTRDGGCTVRLSLALPKGEHKPPPRKELCEFLFRRSREGLEKDRVVWENRCETSPTRYTSLDEPVREFRAFCARFAESPSDERIGAH